MFGLISFWVHLQSFLSICLFIAGLYLLYGASSLWCCRYKTSKSDLLVWTVWLMLARYLPLWPLDLNIGLYISFLKFVLLLMKFHILCCWKFYHFTSLSLIHTSPEVILSPGVSVCNCFWLSPLLLLFM